MHTFTPKELLVVMSFFFFWKRENSHLFFKEDGDCSFFNRASLIGIFYLCFSFTIGSDIAEL